jgi:hypothetical protein
MRFFRYKVTYSEFIKGLSVIAINTRDYLLKYLNDILSNDYLFNNDISWENEVRRRQWELVFFIDSLIALQLENYKNKYPSIKIDFIDNQAEKYGQILNKNEFIATLNNRIEIYRNSLNDGINFLSNCFLSLVWLNIADSKGIQIPHALLEQVTICDVAARLFKMTIESYNNCKIIS